ncbi:MAG: aromatic amino acid lyase [Alphaproteobacteria bacterium]
MTVILERRSDMNLDSYRRVAFGGEGVDFAPAAITTMERTRASFLRLLEEPDIFIYGVTSGWGMEAGRKLNAAEREAHAKEKPNHIGGQSFGGEALPERLVRGIVFARLTNIVEGHSAVRPELAREIAAMLNGPLPPVPSGGNIGSGEIIPLFHLFTPLMGEARSVKEPGALLNGSPMASAMAADTAVLAGRRLRLAALVLALSAEAILAPLAAYDSALDDLWNDPHEARALATLRALLQGGAATRRDYQAPVSYRILPRVLGQAGRAADHMAEVANVALRAVTENPVYVPPHHPSNHGRYPNGRAVSNGGYHNATAAPAMDGLAQSWADIANLAGRHASHLFDGDSSLLPPGLATAESPLRLQLYGWIAVSYVEAAQEAAQRTLIPGREADPADDVHCTAPIAWERERRTAREMINTLAVLAMTASQALHVTGRTAPPALQPLLADVRRLFATSAAMRDHAAEARALADAMEQAVLSGAIHDDRLTA